MIRQVNSTNRNDSKQSLSRSSLALIAILALAVLLVLGLGLGRQNSNEATEPLTLRIGVLPDQDPETLRRRFAPVLNYLSTSLQVPCELRIPESYEQLLNLFHDNEIDLAYFGGYSFVKAWQRDGAVPVVMRRIDTRFTSLFLVQANSMARELKDLQGKRLGFGSKLSTSGHLMSRHFLEQQGIDPETFFSQVEYSGAHDKTVYWVRDGVIDVGVANANTVRSMLATNLVGSDEIRILWETPPYADYVWALQPTLSDKIRLSIRDAFLDLSPDVPEHQVILTELNASGYIPADPEYFSNLESIIQRFEATAATGWDQER